MDEEESFAGSISSKNKLEVCLMTKGESDSSQVQPLLISVKAIFNCFMLSKKFMKKLRD